MKWDELDINSKSELMKLYLKNGITSLSAMKEHYNNYAEGGPIKVDKDYKKSATKMGKIQHFINDWSKFDYTEPTTPEELRTANGGLAQATYLLPRDKQYSLFRAAGYIPSVQDYGLVKKVVGNRNLPIYQTTKDDISRNDLLHIGNTLSEEGDGTYFHHPLVHAGRYPVAYYVNPKTGEPYAKAWDVNDYANSSTNNDKNLSVHIQNAGAKVLDKLGNPVVVTTGYQKLPDIPEELAELMYKKNHLVPTESIEWDDTTGLGIWSLEPVEIVADENKYATGGSTEDSNVLNNQDDYFIQNDTGYYNPQNIARNNFYKMFNVPYPMRTFEFPTPELDRLNYLANFAGFIENRDSVGFDYKTRTWGKPNKEGYDKNNVGQGIDRKTNEHLNKEEQDLDYRITEEREREIRKLSIKDLYQSYNNRINFAKQYIKDFDGNLSKYKQGLMFQAVYKNAKDFADWWTKDNAINFINGTDEDATKLIKDFHKKYFTKTFKGRNEAIDLIRNKKF